MSTARIAHPKCNRRGIVTQFANVTRYGYGLRDELCFVKGLPAKNLRSLPGSVGSGKRTHPGGVLRQLRLQLQVRDSALEQSGPGREPLATFMVPSLTVARFVTEPCSKSTKPTTRPFCTASTNLLAQTCLSSEFDQFAKSATCRTRLPRGTVSCKLGT